MNVNDPKCDCVMVNNVELECNHCTKAAQVAAIRQRLGDIAAGAAYGGDPCKHFGEAVAAIFSVDRFYVANHSVAPRMLDSLAAWLWERGVRG